MKVSVPVSRLKRLVFLVAQMRAGAQGELHAEAGRAVEWLEKVVADSSTDNKGLRARVNSLRREWQEFPTFNATEEHWFRTWEESLSRLDDSDWQAMADFLGYRPKEREKLWQVEKREWFLKDPKDTLQLARKWQKTHGKCGTVHKLFTNTPHGEVVTPDEVTKILSELRENL